MYQKLYALEMEMEMEMDYRSLHYLERIIKMIETYMKIEMELNLRDNHQILFF